MKAVLAGLLACWALMATAAEQRPVITWVIADWPPVTILKDGQPPESAAQLGEGMIDRVLAEIIRRVPQYEHRFQLSTSRRTWHAMELGEPVCHASAFYTPERERLAYFTPALLLPPLSLVLRVELAQQLSPLGQPVSMAQLLNRPDLTGRIEAGRSYGRQLDALIGQQLAREPVSTTGQVSQLVSKGRIDYTLEYASTVEYWRRQGRLGQPVMALPLREAAEWGVAQIACTRSPWGQQAIAAIDAAIRAASANRGFRDAVFSWNLSPPTEAERQKVDNFFNERMQRTPLK